MTEKETLNGDPNIIHDETKKAEYILKFIKAVKTIEYTMEPFKEQKRDLRQSFANNNWLTKKEQRLAIKALRMIDADDDPDQLLDFYHAISEGIGAE